MQSVALMFLNFCPSLSIYLRNLLLRYRMPSVALMFLNFCPSLSFYLRKLSSSSHHKFLNFNTPVFDQIYIARNAGLT
ncbi:hypothetical protein QVD17_28829 [Tagetes erecta]|uniref:Uncharacterized protein n=1 Tax=Tagetes erecta TaxID=13708 RepID=A0AAD8NSH0_TARER|nr:hypothetical protein QVD17_28829 [Tagetes erecta]